MTKIDWNRFKPIPGFDSLKLKAEIQAEILRETEGMTGEQILDFFRKESEAFQAEITRLRTQKQT